MKNSIPPVTERPPAIAELLAVCRALADRPHTFIAAFGKQRWRELAHALERVEREQPGAQMEAATDDKDL
jgi:hypothetical protein